MGLYEVTLSMLVFFGGGGECGLGTMLANFHK